MCSCDFEVNRTKIKGGCQSGRKVVPHDSKSDLPLLTLLESKPFKTAPESVKKYVMAKKDTSALKVC